MLQGVSMAGYVKMANVTLSPKFFADAIRNELVEGGFKNRPIYAAAMSAAVKEYAKHTLLSQHMDFRVVDLPHGIYVRFLLPEWVVGDVQKEFGFFTKAEFLPQDFSNLEELFVESYKQVAFKMLEWSEHRFGWELELDSNTDILHKAAYGAGLDATQVRVALQEDLGTAWEVATGLATYLEVVKKLQSVFQSSFMKDVEHPFLLTEFDVAEYIKLGDLSKKIVEVEEVVEELA